MKRLLLSLVCAVPLARGLVAAPLSRSELQAVSIEMERIIRSVLSLGELKGLPPKPANGRNPATKADAITTFHRLYLIAKPKFTTTPRMSVWDPKKPLSPARELMRWGFLPEPCPLVNDPNAAIDPKQFGDMVGYFLLRMAELTHLPDARFSPNLMNGAVTHAADARDYERSKKPKG